MDTIRQKVIDYCNQMGGEQPIYAPTRMAEIAPGLIAVEDKSGECDLYFDRARWEFYNNIWEKDHTSLTDQYKKTGLGALSGQAVNTSTIAGMKTIATNVLKAKVPDLCHHHTPQDFDFANAV